MVIVKTEKDITAIKEAVRIWKIAREAIYEQVKAGVSLKELDLLAKEVIEANGGIAAFHNYLVLKVIFVFQWMSALFMESQPITS